MKIIELQIADHIVFNTSMFTNDEFGNRVILAKQGWTAVVTKVGSVSTELTFTSGPATGGGIYVGILSDNANDLALASLIL